MSETNSSKLVVLDGATGYLGTHLVQALHNENYKIRCLVRHNTDPANLEYLKSTGAEIVKVDYNEKKNTGALDGANFAVHLVGSIAPSRKESFSQLHQGMTKWWVDNCEQSKIEKAILVTALGTSESSPSAYHQTKREAEIVLQKSSLNHSILRPSLLIGHQVGIRHSKLVKRLIEMVATRAKVPLIHGGNNKIQPLFIGDMAKCIIRSFELETAQPADLAGPEILTLANLVYKLGDLLGKKPKIAAINPQLGLAIASFLSVVQDVPILSKDQVILAQMDNITSDERNKVEMFLNHKGTSLSDSIDSYRSSTLIKDMRLASQGRI